MKKLEVFFDYACPYCGKAHARLVELLAGMPALEPVWRPCEAHPRPERYGPHSDLCIRGMFYARDNGLDLMAYHERMYRAALVDRIRIEDAEILAAYVWDLVDAKAFRKMLESGTYVEELNQANAYAYDQSSVWVVPAYRMDGKKLDAVEDIGVTREQLRSFLGGNG